MGRLAGKTATIAGGTSGIGLASAGRFAMDGASVYTFGRRQAELDQAVLTSGAGTRACDAVFPDRRIWIGYSRS